MLKDITLGQFYPVKSPIHSLDARTNYFGETSSTASLKLQSIVPSVSLSATTGW